MEMVSEGKLRPLSYLLSNNFSNLSRPVPDLNMWYFIRLLIDFEGLVSVHGNQWESLIRRHVMGKDEDRKLLSFAGDHDKFLALHNNLRGNLIIRGLGHLRNSTTQVVLKYAKNLKAKKCIRSLELYWDLYQDNASTTIDDEYVLEALQPHQNLKNLKIDGYMGANWPSWMMIQRNPSELSLPNLVRIHLERCNICQHLPPMLGQLPYLRSLKIQNCNKLRSLSGGEGIQRLTSLQTLQIKEFNELGLSEDDDDNEDTQLFQGLRKLEILDCKKLESLPEGLYRLSCLEKLSISDCPNFLSFPIGGLPTNLTSLLISECENLRFLPDQMHKLTSLQRLSISGCPSLIVSPGEFLPTNLVSLSIIDCENLPHISRWDLDKLIYLEDYTIIGGYADLGCQQIFAAYPAGWDI